MRSDGSKEQVETKRARSGNCCHQPSGKIGSHDELETRGGQIMQVPPGGNQTYDCSVRLGRGGAGHLTIVNELANYGCGVPKGAQGAVSNSQAAALIPLSVLLPAL